MPAGFWRFAVAPSDAAEKNRNIGAQLQSLTCIKAQRCFGKFTCYMTCLFIPSPFSTTYTNFDNCCLRSIAICGKIFYLSAPDSSALEALRDALYKCTTTTTTTTRSVTKTKQKANTTFSHPSWRA